MRRLDIVRDVADSTSCAERVAADSAPRPSALGEHAGVTLLADAVSAACYVTDETGLVTYFNEAAADLWGRRPELYAELWSGSYRVYNLDGHLVTPEERPIAQTIMRRGLVEPKVAVVERPDNSHILVCSHPKPLFDKAGKFIGALNLLVDVSKARSDCARLQEVQRLAEIGRKVVDLSNDLSNVLSVFANVASVMKRGDATLALEAADLAAGTIPRAKRLVAELKGFAGKQHLGRL